jgi:hypothetical protein
MANDTPRNPPSEPDAVPDATGQEAPADDDVQGYYRMICASCRHSHNAGDPKCTPTCLHGSAFHVYFGTVSQPY